jgi:GNAT superfamily N-acetyltransferase
MADVSDLPRVLAVQHNAFGRVERHFGLVHGSLPPMRESVEDLRRHLEDGTRILVAVDSDGRIVASVRGSLVDETVEVGRLVVDDGCERQGLATMLMRALEDAFPDAGRFELFTAAAAVEPLALYAKLGYTVFRRQLTDEGYEMVWLEKIRA